MKQYEDILAEIAERYDKGDNVNTIEVDVPQAMYMDSWGEVSSSYDDENNRHPVLNTIFGTHFIDIRRNYGTTTDTN